VCASAIEYVGEDAVVAARKGSDAMKFEEIGRYTREFDGLYERWLLAANADDESLEAQGMNHALSRC
jgi:hypothetical protein